MTDREIDAVGQEDVDPALTALQDIDRAVRSLYEARPALAHCPDYVADMLGHVAREQASYTLRLADLLEKVEKLRQRRALVASPDPARSGTDGEVGDGQG